MLMQLIFYYLGDTYECKLKTERYSFESTLGIVDHTKNRIIAPKLLFITFSAIM